MTLMDTHVSKLGYLEKTLHMHMEPSIAKVMAAVHPRALSRVTWTHSIGYAVQDELAELATDLEKRPSIVEQVKSDCMVPWLDDLIWKVVQEQAFILEKSVSPEFHADMFVWLAIVNTSRKLWKQAWRLCPMNGMYEVTDNATQIRLIINDCIREAALSMISPDRADFDATPEAAPVDVVEEAVDREEQGERGAAVEQDKDEKEGEDEQQVDGEQEENCEEEEKPDEVGDEVGEKQDEVGDEDEEEDDDDEDGEEEHQDDKDGEEEHQDDGEQVDDVFEEEKRGDGQQEPDKAITKTDEEEKVEDGTSLEEQQEDGEGDDCISIVSESGMPSDTDVPDDMTTFSDEELFEV
jgi:hypothetical protein